MKPATNCSAPAPSRRDPPHLRVLEELVCTEPCPGIHEFAHHGCRKAVREAQYAFAVNHLGSDGPEGIGSCSGNWDEEVRMSQVWTGKTYLVFAVAGVPEELFGQACLSGTYTS